LLLTARNTNYPFFTLSDSIYSLKAIDSEIPINSFDAKSKYYSRYVVPITKIKSPAF